MDNQERVEHIKNAIERAVKDCAFTFENLRVEFDRPTEINGYEAEVKITFRFNDFGNNNKSLV